MLNPRIVDGRKAKGLRHCDARNVPDYLGGMADLAFDGTETIMWEWATAGFLVLLAIAAIYERKVFGRWPWHEDIDLLQSAVGTPKGQQAVSDASVPKQHRPLNSDCSGAQRAKR